MIYVAFLYKKRFDRSSQCNFHPCAMISLRDFASSACTAKYRRPPDHDAESLVSVLTLHVHSCTLVVKEAAEERKKESCISSQCCWQCCRYQCCSTFLVCIRNDTCSHTIGSVLIDWRGLQLTRFCCCRRRCCPGRSARVWRSHRSHPSGYPCEGSGEREECVRVGRIDRNHE